MKNLNDKSPLMIALLVALTVCGAVSFALYLNDDWRQTTFALIEEAVNEEGEIVKKVKVERPEPNREQVREIARNQELKKREKLKENAKLSLKFINRYPVSESNDLLKISDKNDINPATKRLDNFELKE